MLIGGLNTLNQGWTLETHENYLSEHLPAFCIGFATCFVVSVREIDKFKGCPVPEYFRNETP